MEKEQNLFDRKSSIELLRILAIIMIIGHHYIYYGIQQNYNSDIAGIVFGNGNVLNKLCSVIILPGGVVGVAIFFIITGYFSLNSDEFGLCKIVIPVFFYSTLGMVVYFVISIINCNEVLGSKLIRECILAFFPIGNSIYWFATAYVLLMLMKSTLNRMLKKVNPKYLLILLISFWLEYSIARQCIGPFLSVIEAVFYYLIGASISILEKEFSLIKRGFYFFLFIIGWCGYVILTHTGISWIQTLGITFFGTLSSLGVFLFFVFLDIKTNRHINYLGRLTFDVYLIHEHPLLRETIWNHLLKCSLQYESLLFPLIAIVVITLCYIVCNLIAVVCRQLAINLIIEKWKSIKGSLLI